MATRGSIPKIMEMAGVEMLPPEAGVAWIRRELLSGDHRGEVIVAGALGPDGRRAAPWRRRDLTALVARGKPGPMLGTADVSASTTGVVVKTTLDPARAAVPGPPPDRRHRPCCPG